MATEAECTAQGIQFVPVVAETSGGWGPTGVDTLQRLAKAKARRTGEETGKVLSQFLEVLSVAIRAANAKAVLRRMGDDTSGAAAAIQRAADTLAAADAA